jgi:hypothetical protein
MGNGSVTGPGLRAQSSTSNTGEHGESGGGRRAEGGHPGPERGTRGSAIYKELDPTAAGNIEADAQHLRKKAAEARARSALEQAKLAEVVKRAGGMIEMPQTTDNDPASVVKLLDDFLRDTRCEASSVAYGGILASSSIVIPVFLGSAEIAASAWVTPAPWSRTWNIS